jgi:hypothetical protein
MDKVIDIYRTRIQGMAQAADEVMAAFRTGIEGAVFLGDGGLLELRTFASYREGVSWHRSLLDLHHESETICE